jgi:choline dehydrogenase-like flavoprotein
MFIDSRWLEDGAVIRSEVCIIGAGMAGIALGLEFEKHGIQTCLLESGGTKASKATRDLSRGESVGIPYQFADGCRGRYLGGSSNCWGGWCRPLEVQDFAHREWVPNSGWPFTKPELEPYYKRSHSLLKLGPYRYDVNFWIDALGKPQLLSGKIFFATAKIFVLATGGIENARLLLASNKVRPNGLGNDHDLVGRYFMDHPRLCTGKINFRNGYTGHMLYDVLFNFHNKLLAAEGTCFAAQFALTPELQAKERLLNARVSFSSVFFGKDTGMWEALGRIKHRFARDASFDEGLVHDIWAVSSRPALLTKSLFARILLLPCLIQHARFQAIIEPLPVPESRVTLSRKRDRLGMNRVIVDWRLGSEVKRTLDRTVAIIAEELTNAGVGEVILDPPIEGGEWPPSFEKEGSWHHMGTTRMHESPKLGVVDKNCRLHGTSNFYVAGSSVFPTAGGDFPTITIIALALRLADHIDAELRRQALVGTPCPILTPSQC